MKKTYLTDEFSLKVLNKEIMNFIDMFPMNSEGIPETVDSRLNNEKAAEILSEAVGFKIGCNNEPFELKEGDDLIVADIDGGKINLVRIHLKGLDKIGLNNFVKDECRKFYFSKKDVPAIFKENHEIEETFYNQIASIMQAIHKAETHQDLWDQISELYQNIIVSDLYRKASNNASWHLFYDFITGLYSKLFDKIRYE